MIPLDRIRPRTLSGVKQLARKLREQRGISHQTALDTAARQAGFSCYSDAHTTFKLRNALHAAMVRASPAKVD